MLARGRREALADGGPSLSPRSLLDLEGVERLVLPGHLSRGVQSVRQ